MCGVISFSMSAQFAILMHGKLWGKHPVHHIRVTLIMSLVCIPIIIIFLLLVKFHSPSLHAAGCSLQNLQCIGSLKG